MGGAGSIALLTGRYWARKPELPVESRHFDSGGKCRRDNVFRDGVSVGAEVGMREVVPVTTSAGVEADVVIGVAIGAWAELADAEARLSESWVR
jgi:hypothetical protein